MKSKSSPRLYELDEMDEHAADFQFQDCDEQAGVNSNVL